MRKTAVLLLASLPLLSGAHITWAQEIEAFSADTLNQACHSLVLAIRGVQPISQEDPGAMLCLGYIAGWSQAMELVEPKPFCWPADPQVQPGDVAELIVAYLEANPEASVLPAHRAVQEAIEEAFPCPEATETEPE